MCVSLYFLVNKKQINNPLLIRAYFENEFKKTSD